MNSNVCNILQPQNISIQKIHLLSLGLYGVMPQLLPNLTIWTAQKNSAEFARLEGWHLGNSLIMKKCYGQARHIKNIKGHHQKLWIFHCQVDCWRVGCCFLSNLFGAFRALNSTISSGFSNHKGRSNWCPNTVTPAQSTPYPQQMRQSRADYTFSPENRCSIDYVHPQFIHRPSIKQSTLAIYI